jgi:hypothetical protein
MRSSEHIRQAAGGAFLRMCSSENVRQMSVGAFCACVVQKTSIRWQALHFCA